MLLLPSRCQLPLASQRCFKTLYAHVWPFLSAEARGYTNQVTIKLGDVYETWRMPTQPNTTATLHRQQAMKIYQNMAHVRHLKHVASALHRQTCHNGCCCTPTQQEAVVVGMNAALRPKDCVITSFYCHGWSILRGLSDLAALRALSTGCHSNCEHSQLDYCSSAQVSLGTGIALACKFKGDNSVCVTLQGGSSAENQRHMFASYQMARLWKLPAIFVCENWECGIGTTIKQSGFPLPGLYVNAIDVLAVHNATAFAMDFAEKYGPILIEVRAKENIATEFSSQDSVEVPVEALKKQRDSIEQFKNICIAHGLTTEAELKRVDAKVRMQLAGVVEQLKQSKAVPAEEHWTDVLDGNKKTGVRVATDIKQNHFRVAPSTTTTMTTDPTATDDILVEGEKIIAHLKRGSG